jgi:hypothetical protein
MMGATKTIHPPAPPGYDAGHIVLVSSAEAGAHLKNVTLQPHPVEMEEVDGQRATVTLSATALRYMFCGKMPRQSINGCDGPVQHAP